MGREGTGGSGAERERPQVRRCIRLGETRGMGARCCMHCPSSPCVVSSAATKADSCCCRRRLSRSSDSDQTPRISRHDTEDSKFFSGLTGRRQGRPARGSAALPKAMGHKQPSFISDLVWDQMLELVKLPDFRPLLKNMEENLEAWKVSPRVTASPP